MCPQRSTKRRTIERRRPNHRPPDSSKRVSGEPGVIHSLLLPENCGEMLKGFVLRQTMQLFISRVS